MRGGISGDRVDERGEAEWTDLLLCDLLPLKINVVQSNRLYNLKSYLVEVE